MTRYDPQFAKEVGEAFAEGAAENYGDHIPGGITADKAREEITDLVVQFLKDYSATKPWNVHRRTKLMMRYKALSYRVLTPNVLRNLWSTYVKGVA